jgi:hypothetical protein
MSSFWTFLDIFGPDPKQLVEGADDQEEELTGQQSAKFITKSLNTIIMRRELPCGISLSGRAVADADSVKELGFACAAYVVDAESGPCWCAGAIRLPAAVAGT